MTVSVVLIALWVLLVLVLALMPRRAALLRAGWILVVSGIPIVGYATWQHGPWVGMAMLGVGVLLLRLPSVRPGRRAGEAALQQESR